MKIGILTFHFVNNFGGALQAYSLRRVISEECEIPVVIVDYRNWFIRLTDRIRLFPITTNPREFLSGCRTMKERIGRRTKFGVFTKENNDITRKYSNHWQLKKCKPDVDKFICGSDQIWNPFITFGVSYSYFLRFEPNSNNRISYAPSFGTNGISKCFEKKIKRYLNGIEHLSVREQTGVEYIRRLTGKSAERLIDPTFLLSKDEWGKVSVNPTKERGPYILLYIMQRDENVYEYVKRIKASLGIRIVEISRYGFNPGYVDETLINVGPSEFLGLFKEASYVCTNSYHGLAYSIIFEKDFCLIPCKRFQARIDNLLELLKISSIQTHNGKRSIEEVTATYDKQMVRSIISKEREKALQYLKESIENNI